MVRGSASKQQVPHRAFGPIRNDIVQGCGGAMVRERRYYVYIMASKRRSGPHLGAPFLAFFARSGRGLTALQSQNKSTAPCDI